MAAKADAPDETIGKYEQEKIRVSAVRAPAWDVGSHNHPHCHEDSALGMPSCEAARLSDRFRSKQLSGLPEADVGGGEEC